MRHILGENTFLMSQNRGAVTKVTKMVTDSRPGPGTVVPRALRLGAGVRGQRPRIDGGEHLQPKSILQGWQV